MSRNSEEDGRSDAGESGAIASRTTTRQDTLRPGLEALEPRSDSTVRHARLGGEGHDPPTFWVERTSSGKEVGKDRSSPY